MIALYLTFQRLNVICTIYGISPYRAVNTFHHGYKNQSVNYVYNKSRCLFWDPYKTLNAKRHHVEFLYIKPGGK